MNRILSFFLVISMFFATPGIHFQARTIGAVPKTHTAAYTHKAKLLQEEGTETGGELSHSIRKSSNGEFEPKRGSTLTFTSEEALIAYLKEKLIEREPYIQLQYLSTKANLSFYDFFNEACSHDMESPFGGDYLYFQSRGVSISADCSVNAGQYLYDVEINTPFYTTYEQEQYVDQQTDAILQSLQLENKSEYEKVYAIYNYICQNVEYDFENLYDDSYTLKHSAYAALHDGMCVCDGYASLLYCMLLKAGIDCRMIIGEAGDFTPLFENHEYHAWNIIKVENLYYNADPTWDAGSSYFGYFLLSDESFNENPSHEHRRDDTFTSEAFYAMYPMSEIDNPFAETLSGQCGINGDNIRWAFSDGILHLSGSGKMQNFLNSDENMYIIPWSDFRQTIKRIEIGNGITSLSTYSFYGCTNLRQIEFPDSLKSIGDYCFSNCQSLTTIRIPNSVTDIGEGAFTSCYGLTSVTLSTNLRELSDLVFCGCDSLLSLELPAGISRIGYEALGATQQLKSINLPSTLKIIDTCAFSGTALEQIDIPKSVEIIGGGAFSGSYIQSIHVSEENLNYRDIDGVLYDKSGKTLVSYPAGRPDSSYSVPNGVERIDDYAFEHSWQLFSISVPNSLKSIGKRAFAICRISELILPDGVIEIGEEAFCNSALSSFVIPAGLTEIRDCTFKGTKIMSIIIPDQVISIGNYAFQDCRLKSIIIPDSVKHLGIGVFSYCTDLTSLTLGTGVSRIDNEMLEQCNLLSEIRILNPYCVLEDFDYAEEHIRIFSENATIYGYEYSYAQYYALRFHQSFVSIGTISDIIQSISVSSSGVTVDIVQGSSSVAVLIVASYDEDGRFLSVAFANVSGSGSIPVTLNTDGAARITAFLVDSLSSMKPICPSLRWPF